jgi:glutathione S-transferase
MMMTLRSSPTSPFGRKVVIAAAILGLSDQIDVVITDTRDPEETLRLQNPLGQIPTLILADGQALFDSRVILEYLDAVAGGGKIIPNDRGRFASSTRQALADKMMDASILQLYEQRFHEPDSRSTNWIEHQASKVARALAAAENDPPVAARDVGAIALACALGYLDLRFAGAWRAHHPALVAWLDGFAAAVRAFEATRVKA